MFVIQREFLRLDKQSRRLPVLKILRIWLNCTLLFVERVTQSPVVQRRSSAADLYPRKSSNREENACTFSHNKTPFLKKRVHLSDRRSTHYVEHDQWCNPTKNGFARALIVIAPHTISRTSNT